MVPNQTSEVCGVKNVKKTAETEFQIFFTILYQYLHSEKRFWKTALKIQNIQKKRKPHENSLFKNRESLKTSFLLKTRGYVMIKVFSIFGI